MSDRFHRHYSKVGHSSNGCSGEGGRCVRESEGGPRCIEPGTKGDAVRSDTTRAVSEHYLRCPEVLRVRHASHGLRCVRANRSPLLALVLDSSVKLLAPSGLSTILASMASNSHIVFSLEGVAMSQSNTYAIRKEAKSPCFQ